MLYEKDERTQIELLTIFMEQKRLDCLIDFRGRGGAFTVFVWFHCSRSGTNMLHDDRDHDER
jgi:hypothetical protein